MKLQRPTSRTLILVGVISIVVGALLIEMIAIAKRWDGLAREISFLVAFPALPLATDDPSSPCYWSDYIGNASHAQGTDGVPANQIFAAWQECQ